MSTLTKLDHNPQTNWRTTHIHIGEGAAQTVPYGADAAIADVDYRAKLHGLLDQRCAEESIVMDRAARLHAALDRYLDKHGDSAEEPEEEEPPEESGDDDEPDEAEHSAKQHSGRDSVAMDAGRCKECRIADGKPVPTGIAATVKSIIDFWAKNGIKLRQA